MIKSNFPHKPQLDGVRSICIIFTIFNHVPGTPKWINGSIGVDIFFALSGFLITTLIFAEINKTSSFSIKNFYIRRVFRIIPLYLLAFFATAMAAFAVSEIKNGGSKVEMLVRSWPWILSFNRELCPVSTCGTTFFGHAWTIGIEEKFYIVWPFIFIFILKLPHPRAAFLFFTLSSIFATSLAIQEQIVRGYLGIIFGCIAAIWYSYTKKIPGTPAFWLTIITLGYALSTILQDKYFNILISFGGAWLILGVTYNTSSNISRLLQIGALSNLGKLTYGIYLFHILVINSVVIILNSIDYHHRLRWLVVSVLSYAISIGISHAIYTTIEKPMINYGKKITSH